MEQTRDIHLFTEGGAFCGAAGTCRWSLVQSGVTCPACRELIDALAVRRQQTARRVRLALARLKLDA